VDRARLGREGPLVSRLCLGTATFAGQADETASRAILDRAAAAGVTFLDTADVYPMAGGEPGATEALLGRWLEGRRDDFVLATKGGLPIGGSGGNGRRHLTRALEDSLRRLRTDHVDVYLLHAPDPGTPLDDALETLDTFVRAGKVRHVGCSNFPLELLGTRLGGFAELQPRLNVLQRDDALLAAAGAAGAGVVPLSAATRRRFATTAKACSDQ
jgi:aryl-alcohol dehydrogenase (NADP+)